MKGLLPTGKYHCTIRQSLPDEDMLRLVWTVDEDTDYGWRNIIDEYCLYDWGLTQLENMSQAINFDMYPPHNVDVFYDQFVGLRALLTIGVSIRGNYRKNVILEYGLPTQPAHIDVTRPKTDDHYFEKKNPRKLPI